MAVIPLNKFRTITHTLTSSAVGIYTCPAGVSSLIIYGNVSNIGTGTSVTQFSAFHSRSSVDTEIVSKASIPSDDAMNFIQGRLVLETGDILKIQSNGDPDVMKVIISILENAK
ncbi:MAG: hypothetical protein CBC22_00195 [Alphaproteobacteria bacterium TMED62]|nr:MAG: hypothetical protein CBC22_00195 [Alphaproteobacteria bacterium TMED62]|tara:strand:- start:2705 stop:3046 length:342 start_codon:yes stop_codon:yes gene_type:complete